jgi:hypothetical protein
MDQFTKEGLCTHADRQQSGQNVVEWLNRLVAARGAPDSITIDNGSEFAGREYSADATLGRCPISAHYELSVRTALPLVPPTGN